MLVNADFSQRVAIATASLPWVPSPTAGVERRMLDRVGGEVARATSLVRYAPDSAFPAHQHAMGEEYLVLEGVFSDEAGDFPAGTYVRNPPGSSHAPSSKPGSVIFVKLRQFDAADLTQVVVDTLAGPYAATDVPGVERLHLHSYGTETVVVDVWRGGTAPVVRDYPGGAEFLVLEGGLVDEAGAYPAGTWLRLPAGCQHTLSSPSGARVWVKTGHLPPAQIAP